MIDFTKEQSKIAAQDFQKLCPYFICGNIADAMKLMESIPGAENLLVQYTDIFEHEHYLRYAIPDNLNALLIYQQYFRNVFYLKMEENEAEEALQSGLQRVLNIPHCDENTLAEEMERTFRSAGYHFLGGKTNGHYGPYIWKTTLPTTFMVELTDVVCKYTVHICKDFIFRSWMDYLTFGAIGTGGWTSPDGTIHCIEKAYDLESEEFKVSLLKHEAQHAQDLKRWPQIKPHELEYRAKLVELIFTEQAKLLEHFIAEADQSRTGDSHAVASARIASELGRYAGMDISAIRQRARELFESSTDEMANQYRN